MRPRERRDTGEQDLFRSRLDQIIDMGHPLAKLARTIDWRFLEQQFGAVYSDGVGRPPLPTRLMAGLAILKHTFNLSDEMCLRTVDREPVLSIFLRRGILPACSAARSFFDDPLAQPHGRGTPSGAAPGEPCGRDQHRRHETIRSRARHRRHHGAAEERHLPDRRQARNRAREKLVRSPTGTASSCASPIGGSASSPSSCISAMLMPASSVAPTILAQA